MREKVMTFLVVSVPLAWSLAYVFFLDERLSLAAAAAIGGVLGAALVGAAIVQSRKTRSGTRERPPRP